MEVLKNTTKHVKILLVLPNFESDILQMQVKILHRQDRLLGYRIIIRGKGRVRSFSSAVCSLTWPVHIPLKFQI